MDSEARKRVLRQVTYGLYVVTTKHNEQVAAGTVNWATQGSFEPPLVVVCMKSDSGIATLSRESGIFNVNILGVGQKEVAAAFFKPSHLVGDTINGVRFKPGENGAPVLIDLPAAFECQVEEVVRKGDHDVVIGRVTAVHEYVQVPPLAMAATGWYYGG